MVAVVIVEAVVVIIAMITSIVMRKKKLRFFCELRLIGDQLFGLPKSIDLTSMIETTRKYNYWW